MAGAAFQRPMWSPPPARAWATAWPPATRQDCGGAFREAGDHAPRSHVRELRIFRADGVNFDVADREQKELKG